MQEVVRGEVLKLLQAGIIYPISDSLWDRLLALGCNYGDACFRTGMDLANQVLIL
ncbi:hypothetical protein CK203_064072 [Vitis vinifera]|uniref:Uncharacterized protein n=1 Tax=Vitis vinifera TaxID=29760 RepID=A0A438G424_VITVI|nr:hypothetical protein CK203_064072 [Vitis vinifera]